MKYNVLWGDDPFYTNLHPYNAMLAFIDNFDKIRIWNQKKSKRKWLCDHQSDLKLSINVAFNELWGHTSFDKK